LLPEDYRDKGERSRLPEGRAGPDHLVEQLDSNAWSGVRSNSRGESRGPYRVKAGSRPPRLGGGKFGQELRHVRKPMLHSRRKEGGAIAVEMTAVPNSEGGPDDL
jgi:hypothetical protein